MHDASFRAKLLAHRTYQRPLDNGGHETWRDMCFRVCEHQQWLWERALGRELNDEEAQELGQLYALMVQRKALPSGRILWMGGTEQAKKTEIAMFNCSFAVVRDVYSAVDAFYLLLNGCGVGFKPEAGLLNGFSKKCQVQITRSHRQTKGNPENEEHFVTDAYGTTWVLRLGDSGVAWAKAFGKLLAMKRPVDTIRLDFQEIRPPGSVLSGYGWLSSGDEQIASAFVKLCKILNDRAGELLDEIDIVDIINLVGTTLTSRRSAEIALVNADNPNAERFATMKENHYEKGMPWRSQSNNSLVFYSRPSKLELRGLFSQLVESGGSEPGFYNGEAARRRAPWFAGTNPCGEILLGDGGLCNLVDIDLGKFIGKWDELCDAVRLIARANYRQTCVYLKDGVLSDKWHETQEFLRLCGVGLTGITKWLDNDPMFYWGEDGEWEEKTIRPKHQALQDLRWLARANACEMADALGLPRPKAVTTVKPSGTLGKIMDTTEGLHRPIGRYVFNWVKFHVDDPLNMRLLDAGYRSVPDPYSTVNVLWCIPVDNGPGNWTVTHGVEVNLESAVDQLDRYKLLMDNYVDHNASVTIYYDNSEVSDIVDWLYANWDSYVGVSFLPRTDPTKTAEDMGYPYLPQQVVSEQEYREYVDTLKEVDLVGDTMVDTDECAGGACPVR